MGRVHAMEWEDLRWFPASWRDYGTDYLCFIANKFDIYKNAAPLIAKGIKAGNGKDWVDLAAGGGGGLLKLSTHLKGEFPGLKILLTDFYPNEEAFKRTAALGGSDTFSYEKKSVDAAQLPAEMKGKFRSIFGAFHHFRPEDAKKILQDAVDTQSPIGVFEPVGRNFPSFLSMLFVIPNVLLLTPFIRPVRWSVLPFIYLLPLIPLYVMWDGIASLLRTYSEKELKAMVASLHDSDSFEWEIGSKPSGPMKMYYLTGIPKSKK